MIRQIYILLTILTGIALIPTAMWAAEPYADTMTGIHHPDFRTLQVRQLDASDTEKPVLGIPVIDLDSDDGIVVTFDELTTDLHYLRYELRHCDALWNPDNLVDSEYLDGFNQANVEDVRFSSSTLPLYVNYRIPFPSEQMRPTISGNYILRVYPEEEPDSTLVQVRIAVSENSASVKGSVTTRTDYDFDDRHQQLELEVDKRQININDIFSDLKVIVEQDGRTDNMALTSRPLRVSGTKAYFEHNRDLIFNAGNEYRRFEAIDEHYPNRGVDKVGWYDPFYHYTLLEDSPRSNREYDYDFSQQGLYVVRQSGASDSDVDADYGVMHFTLKSPKLADYDIYIEGDLTQRTLDEASRMRYDESTGAYHAELLLKQGAYSYQYLAVPKGKSPSGNALTSVIEGDYYPTVHTYKVMVYYREPGGRYDRLAAYTNLR